MFHHSTLLIYIRRSGLELYQLGADAPLIFPFPPELVRDLEVMNEKSLIEALESFFRQNQVSHATATVLLSEEVTFHQVSQESDQAQRLKLEDDFLSNIPLDPETIIHNDWQEAPDRFHTFAVDKRLYMALKTSLEREQSQLLGVFPGFLFGIADTSQVPFGQVASLSTDQVQRGMSEVSHLKDQNLLLHEPAPTTEKKERPRFALPSQKQETPKQQLIAVAVFVLFMAGVGLFLLLTLKRQATELKKPAPTPISLPSPTAQPSIVPSPVATASPSASLSQLTVNILNASGRAGVAAQVRDAFATLGFSQFTLGNAPLVTGATTVAFSSRVPPETQTAVEVKLKQFAAQLTPQTSASTSKFDIVIIIAK